MARPAAVSVAIIALDEERNLGRCLQSVAWAGEIVVVDGGSRDRTVEIARRYGARVVVEPWRGFAAQKNLALSLASSPWVLSLDADEWLGPDGAEAIAEAVSVPRADAYALNRLNAFSGGFASRALSPDWQVRLFRKDRGRFVGEWVHERLALDPGCRVARLPCRLYHLTCRSLADYVAKMNRYTDLSARGLLARGRRVGPAGLLFHAVAAFLKPYLLRGGFLDGTRGLLASATAGYAAALKYGKLWELTRPADPGFLALVPPTAEDPRPDLPPQSE